MDPVLIMQLWWAVPATAVAGTAGVVAVRRHRSVKGGRRLAYDAARHDVRTAQQAVTDSKMAVKVARADTAHIVAERAANRASAEHVAVAKRMLREKERDVRAAVAELHARRVRLTAARAAIPTASGQRPLDRLRGEHDAVVGRWMLYETDPGLLISYPAMTDVKQPATAAYLKAAAHAVEMRRITSYRITPADYAAYRDAVSALEQAFALAEVNARTQAGERPPAPAWQDSAQRMFDRSTEAFDQAAGAVASALDAWSARRRPRDR